jgi:hypothetical protein
MLKTSPREASTESILAEGRALPFRSLPMLRVTRGVRGKREHVQTRDHGRGAIVDVAQGNDQCVQRKDHSGHGGDGGGDLLPPRHRLVDLWTGQGEQRREIRKRRGGGTHKAP